MINITVVIIVRLIKITNIDVEQFKSSHLKIIVEIQCIQMQKKKNILFL
jgi:hypothetical protein